MALDRRACSLCSCPGEDKPPAIPVRKVTGGKMRKAILDYAADIQQWAVNRPDGSL
jgi:hypothetical protein